MPGWPDTVAGLGDDQAHDARTHARARHVEALLDRYNAFPSSLTCGDFRKMTNTCDPLDVAIGRSDQSQPFGVELTVCGFCLGGSIPATDTHLFVFRVSS